MMRWKKRAIALLLTMAMVTSGCALFKVNQVNQQTTQPTQNTPSNNNPGTPFNPVTPDTNRPAELAENPDYYFDIYNRNPSDWQIAYANFLSQFMSEHVNNSPDANALYQSSGYFLADIDDAYNTFVPELCIKHGTCEADYDLWVYTYDQTGGDVILLADSYDIPASHTSFAQGPNGDLYAYGGHMGYLWVYHLKKWEAAMWLWIAICRA